MRGANSFWTAQSHPMPTSCPFRVSQIPVRVDRFCMLPSGLGVPIPRLLQFVAWLLLLDTSVLPPCVQVLTAHFKSGPIHIVVVQCFSVCQSFPFIFCICLCFLSWRKIGSWIALTMFSVSRFCEYIGVSVSVDGLVLLFFTHSSLVCVVLFSLLSSGVLCSSLMACMMCGWEGVVCAWGYHVLWETDGFADILAIST